MGMFRIYGENQNGKFYLSPYTDVIIEKEKLFVHQRLFHCTVQVQCDSAWGEDLLRMLQKGIREQALEEFLTQNMGQTDARKLINDWMRMGVIE